MTKLCLSSHHLQIKTCSTVEKDIHHGRQAQTHLSYHGLIVGTIVTLSLYMLSNSVLSVAAVPVIPQSFGNCSANM